MWCATDFLKLGFFRTLLVGSSIRMPHQNAITLILFFSSSTFSLSEFLWEKAPYKFWDGNVIYDHLWLAWSYILLLQIWFITSIILSLDIIVQGFTSLRVPRGFFSIVTKCFEGYLKSMDTAYHLCKFWGWRTFKILPTARIVKEFTGFSTGFGYNVFSWWYIPSQRCLRNIYTSHFNIQMYWFLSFLPVLHSKSV